MKKTIIFLAVICLTLTLVTATPAMAHWGFFWPGFAIGVGVGSVFNPYFYSPGYYYPYNYPAPAPYYYYPYSPYYYGGYYGYHGGYHGYYHGGYHGYYHGGYHGNYYNRGNYGGGYRR